MKKLLIRHSIFLGLLILFGLLLFKDPFSERTLIPNFEPYPDALYYVVSARSLSQGQGLTVVRENRTLEASIPPLYSLFLSPVYIFNNDPRAFYFINIILAVASFLIFYQILSRIIDRLLIKSFVLFLYIANYFIYWMPKLAIA